MAWDVFLAYPQAERRQARFLYDALTSAGLRVCFDQEVLRAGDDWHVLLPRYVRSCRVVAALISVASEQAHFERSEILIAIAMARREGRRLVPIHLSPDVEAPYGTEQLHAINMFTADDVDDVAARIVDVAQLPTDVAEIPGTRVFCQRTPVPPRCFTGREDVLSDLGASAHLGTATVLTQTLHGMGGVGKTSLAAAAVEALSPQFDIVWWVRAEDPAILAVDLAELGSELGLPVLDEPAAVAEAVRNELQATNRSWLLVFDNAQDGRSIERWVPRRGNGSVLITSRSADFGDVDVLIDVDTFPPSVAEQFLRRRVGQRNPAAADEPLAPILERLDGLPLALEQAAAWVAQVPNRRFASFAELFDDASGDPFSDGSRPVGYDHTATTTWRVSLAAAAERAPFAERVMALLGYFAPEEVPCQWIRDMGDDDYFDRAGTIPITTALDELHLYSLVKISSNDRINVHRVIQTAARRNASVAAASAAVRVLKAQVSDDMGDPRNWAPVAAVEPHALAAVTHLQPVLSDQAAPLCDVLHAVAEYQRLSGAVYRSIDTSKVALDLALTYLGTQDPTSLRARGDVAGGYHAARMYANAIDWYEALVSDQSRILSADHPETLRSRHALACSQLDAGNLTVAIQMLEKVFARRRELLDPDHPDILHSRHYLGTAYGMTRNDAKATPMLETVLADRERVLGQYHPDTADTRNNLGGRYQNTGTPERAIPLFQANLEHCEREWPANHPFTLVSRNNLGRAYQQTGLLNLAIPLLETNLAERERLLGADHPQTLTSRDRLALAYHASGDVERSVSMLEANLADMERVLGPEHIETLASREKLGLAYRAAGDSERGNALIRATLTVRERNLGPDHPHTRRNRHNLEVADDRWLHGIWPSL